MLHRDSIARFQCRATQTTTLAHSLCHLAEPTEASLQNLLHATRMHIQRSLNESTTLTLLFIVAIHPLSCDVLRKTVSLKLKHTIISILKTPFNDQFSNQERDTLTQRWWSRQRHGSPAHEGRHGSKQMQLAAIRGCSAIRGAARASAYKSAAGADRCAQTEAAQISAPRGEGAAEAAFNSSLRTGRVAARGA
jgi:hypothetical protein